MRVEEASLSTLTNCNNVAVLPFARHLSTPVEVTNPGNAKVISMAYAPTLVIQPALSVQEEVAAALDRALQIECHHLQFPCLCKYIFGFKRCEDLV
jgi:hypothetical protein